MNRDLIHRLSELKMEENALKRQLEYAFKKDKKREKLFFRLKDIKEETNKIKFLLRIESERKKNGDNNSD